MVRPLQVIVPIKRFVDGLRRPSKATSLRRLRERGETVDALVIRESTAADTPALARLHVATFRQTHGGGPTPEIRERQYRQKFAETDGRWFCYVAARQAGELIGFAIGEPADPADGTGGHVSKIYVLREYQRLGLGRRLLAHVSRRFLNQGITSMSLFSQADNPSIWFFDAMGGERWIDPGGDFGGGYRWFDVRPLADAAEPDQRPG